MPIRHLPAYMILSFFENVISTVCRADEPRGKMTEKVLVTGGFGLVGSQTVRRLVADGHDVVATDLGTTAQRKAAGALPAGALARWADLTDRGEVEGLVGDACP